jgi:hypothetical protein
MGYLENANSLVNNTMSELDKILQSGSSISITGLGEPILVTWFNVNDKKSTVMSGIETVDSLLGPDSPFRYNKVERLPIFGVTKDIQNVEMRLDDNGIMDMEVELEPIIPPGTVIPSPYDYMLYKYASGRSVLFRVNNVQIATMRSNGYYKVPMHLVDTDSEDYENKLLNQTVQDMKVILDNVGSNEKCIVQSQVFEDLIEIKDVIGQAISDYIDTFFSRKYNSFIFRGYTGGKYIVYDPYLTKFILNHDILDYYNEILQPVVIEQDDSFRGEYNKTIFRAVEMRDSGRINKLLYDPTSFPKTRANPFSYWGEEEVYLIHTYLDKNARYPKNTYMDFDWIYNLRAIKESNAVTMLENLIIRYFKTDSFEKFLSMEELRELKKVLMEPDYTETYFYLVPIILFILISYKEYLNNSYS